MNNLSNNHLLYSAPLIAAETAVCLVAGAAAGASPLLAGVYLTNRIVSTIAKPVFDKYFDAYFPEIQIQSPLPNNQPDTRKEDSTGDEDGSDGHQVLQNLHDMGTNTRAATAAHKDKFPGITNQSKLFVACIDAETTKQYHQKVNPLIKEAERKSGRDMLRLSITLLVVAGTACATGLFPVHITALRVVAAVAILGYGEVSRCALRYVAEKEQNPANQNMGTTSEKENRENTGRSVHFATTTALWYAGAALLGANPITSTVIFLATRLFSYPPKENRGSVVDNFITHNITDRFIIKPLGDRISASTAEKIRYLSLALQLIPLSFAARLV